MPRKLTTEILTAAIDGYEVQKTRIEAKIAELRAMLSGGPAQAPISEPAKRKRRKFSAAARRHMKEAQQRRWAKIRGESEPRAPATPEPAKPKRRIGKAGMARIIAATKERWARVRAAKAQQQRAGRKAARKKAAVKKAAVKKGAVKKAAPAAPATMEGAGQ
jgi:hypothetical protein